MFFFIIVRFAKGDGGIYILLVAISLKDRLSYDETVNRDFRRKRVGALMNPTASAFPGACSGG
jgi:hypothetical protein